MNPNIGNWHKFNMTETPEDVRRKMVGVAMDNAMRHIDEIYDPSEKFRILTMLGNAIIRPTALLRYEAVAEVVDVLEVYLDEQRQRYAPAPDAPTGRG